MANIFVSYSFHDIPQKIGLFLTNTQNPPKKIKNNSEVSHA